MIPNHNPDTGIAYGYISARALHSDIVQELQDNGTDVYYEENWKEFLANKRAEWESTSPSERDYDDFEDGEDDYLQEFNDNYQPDEPIHEGEKDGVKYRTSWLGGALNVWIFESPYTGRFQECSPCVPNAANLDYPEDRATACGTISYDVPPDWRDDHDER